MSTATAGYSAESLSPRSSMSKILYPIPMIIFLGEDMERVQPLTLILALLAVGVACGAAVGYAMMAASDDADVWPYATLTPTRSDADAIHYDVSDVRGRANPVVMTAHLIIGPDGNNVANSSKFTLRDGGYYEANLTFGSVYFILHLHNVDGVLSDRSFLDLRYASGEFAEGVQYTLRLGDGKSGVTIASASYYAP